MERRDGFEWRRYQTCLSISESSTSGLQSAGHLSFSGMVHCATVSIVGGCPRITIMNLTCVPRAQDVGTGHGWV